VFTCDGQILGESPILLGLAAGPRLFRLTNAGSDATVADVRGMVCCQFLLKPRVKIPSNFEEWPFVCDAAELEKGIASVVLDGEGKVTTFKDRKAKGPSVFRRDDDPFFG